VEIMRKVNHLNLIRLVGLCHHRGRWYLVTEYAEHGVLREGLARLSWAQRVRVALDVAEGLRYLHEYTDPPCVHMDVSSDTVLLAGAEPRAKLRGFAAARAITSSSGNVVFTMTSRIAGTRGYMAPEYLEHGAVSPKADVYALGVVLLELVTGRDVEDLVGGDDVGDPFAGLRDLAALAEDRDHGGTVTRRLEELVDPAMPAGSCPRDAVLIMVRLIERCVRRDAAGRPTTGEVAQRLLKMSGVSVVSWQRSRDPESPRSPGR
jgi:serine/threonine protein kinase